MRQLLDKPSPITGGPLELCVSPATGNFRGETIPYQKTYYHCVESDMEFADSEMEKANLKAIYDAYRKLHGIPLAEELVEMRKRYGIPVRAMSIILGLGENQYGLYEEGTVPTVSVGKLLSLARDPKNMKEMLRSARSSFSDMEYSKYFLALASSALSSDYPKDWLSSRHYGLFAPTFPSAQRKYNTKSVTSRKQSYNHYTSHSYALA